MLAKSPLKYRTCSGCSSAYADVMAQILKLSAVFILLFALLWIAPASAAPNPADGLPEPDREYLFENCENRMPPQLLMKNAAESMQSTVVSSRETKLRSSQKKLTVVHDYHSFADAGGDVFFDKSPVVTGMHLPDGLSGQVLLHPESESAGPKCCEVYSVFTLFVENYPAGEESVIRYTMPLAEIEDRGSHPSEISLYFHDNDSWKKLPTEYYIDSSSAFFESVTTSLGIFAVVLDECTPEVEPVTLKSRHLEYAPVSLEISPVSFLTHPMSYSASAR